ncbi:hypothetical protein THER_0682 [Thermodesulfovibrio sp. N1]|uniref:hypothetical protein n=1 Tax=Thermodesulfovibrio sp. N1 TaxID=1871110 RepID=UPI00083A231C|nr:hypothetical protein [Thermodesulfovibrio sp. N1]ODA44635.1 hypothetical protein THER_0682 [Thermodesulfovibrio sp. N1]
MEKKDFFDNPKNVNKLFILFYLVVFIFLFAEFFVHKHIYFSWEEYPFFYSSFGFVAFVFLILIAKYILRPIVKRKEDYYND